MSSSSSSLHNHHPNFSKSSQISLVSTRPILTPHSIQSIHSFPSSDQNTPSSSTHSINPSSIDMTPAQKIARHVRSSFSTTSHSSSNPSSLAFSSSQLDLNTTAPTSLESLTPAQALAQHARLIDSHPHPSQSPIKLPLNNPSSLSTSTTDSTSFRVISGRKGLPGDGQDKMAVARPVADNSFSNERPHEPKIVKRLSKLCLTSQVPSSLSTSVDSSRSTSTALAPSPSSPTITNTSQISSIYPVASSVTITASQTPAPLVPSTPLISPPVIPVAIFPVYSAEDDTGSMGYSDHEVDLVELDVEEETDEEEDYDSNPLYIVLSTSLSPRLKDAYDAAKLVLLPTRRALPLDMPRKLPDPNLEFESEWEQWIAAHTFVSAAESVSSALDDNRKKESSKDGVEWVASTSMKDKQVNLYLKPGTGIAEVRLTYLKPTPPIGITPSNTSTLPAKPLELVGPADLLTNRSTLDSDPQRTIRVKVDNPSHGHHCHSSTIVPPLISLLPTNPPTGLTIGRTVGVQNTSSMPSPAITQAEIIRSPSTATESSMAFTQSSSGVSRTSSEGWSDMPVTPPNLLASPSPLSRPAVCKSQPLNNNKQVEISFDNKSALPLELRSAAPIPNSISLPNTTITKVQKAKIISEETMYRSPSSSPSKSHKLPLGPASSSQVTPDKGALESALSGSKAKKGKEVEQRLRFKAPKWLRPGAAQKDKDKEKERREKAAAVATARMREEQDKQLSLMTRTSVKLQRVRLISLNSPVIECWWQSSVGGVDDLKENQTDFTQSLQASDESCEKCSSSESEPRTAGIFPFPRTRTSTINSSAEHKSINRSSTSLSQRSTLSSTHQSQSIKASSSSIMMPDDDHSSYQSSNRRESSKRRSRRMLSGLSLMKHSGTNKYRSVIGDFAFLLSPPEEFGAIVCGILRKSVSKVWMHCHRFCETVIFLKGFDSYIVSQLKNEIFEPLIHDVGEDLKKHGRATVDSWNNEDWERLTKLIENVLFAFMHATLYSRGLSCHYASEDDYLDSILHNYRQRKIPLSEFEIELPAALQDENLLTEAVDKLNQLRAYESTYTSPPQLPPELLQRLFVAMDTVDEQMVFNVLMVKTPLECIAIIKQTIDILVSVWNDVSTQAGMDEEARRLTPDDLLALLASVIVRSGIQQQHSLIQYTKVFRFNSSLSPQTDWALVSYQAAIAYLQSDPFSILDSQSIQSQSGSVRSMPPHSPSLAATWARRRPVSFTPPTTSSNAITISTRSSPNCSRLSLTEHIQPRTAPPHTSTISSSNPQTMHRPRSSRGNLLMRSHTPTSSLALVDLPSVRLQVTSARHDHSRSVDCLQASLEGHQSFSRKSISTRPTLNPISTVDKSTRAIDTAMLSAPMIDGGFGRSCSNPWDSSRSLSSIGEIATDPSNHSSSASQSETQDSRTMMRSSVSSQGIAGRNRSFHYPFSNGVQVQKTGLPCCEKSTSPVLSRRKTVDWAGTSSNKIDEQFHQIHDDNGTAEESGNQLISHHAAATKVSHSRSESFNGTSGFAMADRESVSSKSDLGLQRFMTVSSLGQQSSHQELAASQTSEGWLEWGRKRLTSVTSLNTVGGVGNHKTESNRRYQFDERRGSASSTLTAAGGLITGDYCLTSSRSSDLFFSQPQRPTSVNSNGGGRMTPAMEALTRARTNSTINYNHHQQQSSSSSSSSCHYQLYRSQGLSRSSNGSMSSTNSSNNNGNIKRNINHAHLAEEDVKTGGMIPLRPIRAANSHSLSRSIGPTTTTTLNPIPSSTVTITTSNATAHPVLKNSLDHPLSASSGWNRSSNSLQTLN